MKGPVYFPEWDTEIYAASKWKMLWVRMFGKRVDWAPDVWGYKYRGKIYMYGKQL